MWPRLADVDRRIVKMASWLYVVELLYKVAGRLHMAEPLYEATGRGSSWLGGCT